MHTFIRLGTLISVAALVGCSGNASPTATTATAANADRSTRAQPDKNTALIFSSSFGGNSVDYYLKGTGPNNPVAGSLSGSFNNPFGMGVDKRGDLYLANSSDDNVLVYAAGSTSPTNTLNDPNKFPADVAIASDGTVYVANGSGPIGASGNVVVYSPGSTNPTQTLSDAHFFHVSGVALDKSGNLFVTCNAGQGMNSGTVVEFKAGSTTGTDTHIVLGYAGGVGLDGAGHLLAVDEEVPSLNVYTVGNRKPLHKLKLPGTSEYFSFNKDSKMLFVADSGLGEIDVFRYTPSALTQVNKITNGIAASKDNFGIATTPAQQL
jgi:WD40 repeat protein